MNLTLVEQLHLAMTLEGITQLELSKQLSLAPETLNRILNNKRAIPHRSKFVIAEYCNDVLSKHNPVTIKTLAYDLFAITNFEGDTDA